MRILKLLNKRNLSILISFFFIQNSYSNEPVDIWKIDNQSTEQSIVDNEIIEIQDGKKMFLKCRI